MEKNFSAFIYICKVTLSQNLPGFMNNFGLVYPDCFGVSCLVLVISDVEISAFSLIQWDSKCGAESLKNTFEKLNSNVSFQKS